MADATPLTEAGKEIATLAYENRRLRCDLDATRAELARVEGIAQQLAVDVAYWKAERDTAQAALREAEAERDRCEFCHAERGAAHNPLDDGGAECPVRQAAHLGVELVAAEARVRTAEAEVMEARELAWEQGDLLWQRDETIKAIAECGHDWAQREREQNEAREAVASALARELVTVENLEAQRDAAPGRERRLREALAATAIRSTSDRLGCWCEVIEPEEGAHQPHCEQARKALATATDRDAPGPSLLALVPAPGPFIPDTKTVYTDEELNRFNDDALAQARREGMQQMRERAARYFEDDGGVRWLCLDHGGEEAEAIARIIRALAAATPTDRDAPASDEEWTTPPIEPIAHGIGKGRLVEMPDPTWPEDEGAPASDDAPAYTAEDVAALVRAATDAVTKEMAARKRGSEIAPCAETQALWIAGYEALTTLATLLARPVWQGIA